MMEGVRTFLESSTIHGLAYISTSRKYARLFWVLVVITGFIGAIMIIEKSFDSWSESPVKTTIETLPISDIKFPKLTVCPPRNTFTDLNYDMMMTESITLTEEMRDEMFQYALEVLIQDSFSQYNWSKIHVEDRFYNWYHGYEKIESTYYSDYSGKMTIFISNSATSGVATTQYYGEQFRSKLVERKLGYDVFVYPPKNVNDNSNVTLHFKIEKVSMTGLGRGSKNSVVIDRKNVDVDQTSLYTNFTPPGNQRSISLYRDVSTVDVEIQKLDVMPGFKFSWWYTGGEVSPDPVFKEEIITKHLVR